MARWAYLRLRLAVDTEGSVDVRVIETSKRLAWTSLGRHYAFDRMPMGGAVVPAPSGMVHSSAPQVDQHVPPHAWADCLDAIGSDGWELVSVVPVSADARVGNLKRSIAGAGDHDVQIRLFKRERDDGILEDDQEGETGDEPA